MPVTHAVLYVPRALSWSKRLAAPGPRGQASWAPSRCPVGECRCKGKRLCAVLVFVTRSWNSFLRKVTLALISQWWAAAGFRVARWPGEGRGACQVAHGGPRCGLPVHEGVGDERVTNAAPFQNGLGCDWVHLPGNRWVTSSSSPRGLAPAASWTVQPAVPTAARARKQTGAACALAIPTQHERRRAVPVAAGSAARPTAVCLSELRGGAAQAERWGSLEQAPKRGSP